MNNLNYIRLSAFWLTCFFVYLWLHTPDYDEERRAWFTFWIVVSAPCIFVREAKRREP